MAQVNAVVGDISANADLVHEWSQRAYDAGAHLVAFPEMVLTGYPVEDLALRASFVHASRQALERLPPPPGADGHGDLPVVVGYLDRADADEDGEPDADRLGVPKGSPQNAAAVLHQGRVT